MKIAGMVEQVAPDESEALSTLPTPSIWEAAKVAQQLSPLVASVVGDEKVAVSCERFP